MPNEPSASESSARRREGRTLACEGLMASRFGQRPSQSGAKAIQQLRATEKLAAAQNDPILTTEAAPLDRDVEQGWMAYWLKNIVRRLLLTRYLDYPWRFAAATTGACLVVILLGYLTFTQLRPQTHLAVAVLEVHGFGVTVERQGKQLSAVSGLLMMPSDIIQTTKRSKAILHFRQNAARIELFEATEFQLANGGRNGFCEVRRGSLVAEVNHQPPQKPMIFVTPQAEAQVLGTQFALSVKRFSTWLEVLDGQVKLRRAGDGATTEVMARHYAVAAKGLELTALPEDQRWQTPYSLERPGNGTL